MNMGLAIVYCHQYADFHHTGKTLVLRFAVALIQLTLNILGFVFATEGEKQHVKKLSLL
tara:strand:- start:538 stop:714 length:177 start_codon:yes stop_codon:yes gene_type:complete